MRMQALDLPFRHIEMREVFPPDLYRELLAALPSDSAYSDPSNHRDSALPDGTNARLYFHFDVGLERVTPPQRAALERARDFLMSPALAAQVFAALEPGLRLRFGEQWNAQPLKPKLFLVRDVRGYQILPHPDTAAKVVTLQIYLPADDSLLPYGTSLYERAGAGFRKVKTLPFLPNTGYAFAVHNHSWHGVDKIEVPVVRNSLMLIWYLAAKSQSP